MERRGRIPVAKFRTQEGKTRSRSRVREPDYNEQDPETDLFTLLEDNIALKEENKSLKLEIEDLKIKQDEVLKENTKITQVLDTLKITHTKIEEQLTDITVKHAKSINERNALDKLHKMKIEKIHSLERELLQESYNRENKTNAMSMLEVPNSLKGKLLKVLPALNSGGNEMDSLIDMESTAVITSITCELVEQLADEFLALKSSFNTVELQLYEANEKISELIENQNHLDEEIETLRNENTNLTKVAKLLTENMKESVETSKKMESALIKLKQRNDELNSKLRDVTDAGFRDPEMPSPSTIKSNEEFEQFKEEVQNQNRDHSERIVEMKTLMEAAIEKNTNDELKTLQLKVEILEKQLRQAVSRAELAESELVKFKKPSPPPPPPPPPMPATPLYKPAAHSKRAVEKQENSSQYSSGGSGDKIIQTVKHQVQPEAATGVENLIRELKSGRVTLRRNRRKTYTNEALQEMFQVLEISQTQNRSSKICVDFHI